ncbi:glycosyltransferase [Flavobacterium piscis]|uniref:GT2 family glycosyltransferase n=1 Tax=Flavobacterium piscis TaxID=1114874 RepID=A0ABU1Y424_9FLAO|nr:glycosyltransferase [Flavobacterium piscis]MDR7208985.1 GT2 family glycosyltransferase [Flavobacterium piscis]
MKLEDIFVIIILYKNNLENSRTIKTLETSLDKKINLFVYDNSSEKQYPEESFSYNKFNVQYFHDPTNVGLSKAYNYALKLAVNNKCSWLLLLDQDTCFTKEYIDAVEMLRVDKLDKKTVAVIPRVKSLTNNQKISPAKIILGGICRPFNYQEGIITSKISGINSGTILKVDYFKSIDGFNANYTLDMLDHWYFKKIFDDGKNIFLLNATINQDLSVLENFEESVSIERYKQMLKAESLFIMEESFISLAVFKLRLFFRILKQRKFRNKEYYKFTLKILLRHRNA